MRKADNKIPPGKIRVWKKRICCLQRVTLYHFALNKALKCQFLITGWRASWPKKRTCCYQERNTFIGNGFDANLKSAKDCRCDTNEKDYNSNYSPSCTVNDCCFVCTPVQNNGPIISFIFSNSSDMKQKSKRNRLFLTRPETILFTP